MAANVESMFYTREKPWHGLGTKVEEAPTSADALYLAGLDWEVVQEDIFTETGDTISGYKVNIRDSDRRVLGVVSERYKIIQNSEAFAFTDTLLGNGVRYETAGSLQNGKRVWLLARLPREYTLPDFLVMELEEYMDKLYGMMADDRLFMVTKSYLEKEMLRGVKLSGVKKIRLHDLRHSHASLLISKLSAQPNLVADRLGHEKIQTTLSTYSHLYPNQARNLADQLNDLMDGLNDEEEGSSNAGKA